MSQATRRLQKPARIILIGAPGVGKGTQSERLLSRFPQLASISSGDLLRENVRRRTSLGIEAEAAMQSGNLVPDSMILNLISSELKSKGWLTPSPQSTSSSTQPTNYSHTLSPTASFILDGFPRTASQATSLDTLVPVNFVVQLITPPLSFSLGSPLAGCMNLPAEYTTRTSILPKQDDSIDTWKQRLRKFEETSRALIEHYEGRGCVWRVEGNSSDEISPQLFAEIERRFC
ncbi:GTP:AMP phosphotransferase AK3 [Penicillium frequentans]|uniref:GTP:AMP phosphotransferase AK3 n=1 Tax=Penicillium frequentans TaxID=3151616 RepID=A0AAD6D0J6_9EURO|nr:GTP:AMP phosphotransferase AK3 [Penicillium glabrum]